MKRQFFCIISVFLSAMFLAVGMAEAAGTLRLTFKHKDEGGIEKPLSYAYVYLRAVGGAPPMQRFFSPADYVYGPTNSSGYISVSVPDGEYYLRATRRNPLGTRTRPLGPPESGDYSWTPINRITITAGTVTDLGTQYGESFGAPAITISGIIKNTTGGPSPGKYVRAQPEPCIIGDEYTMPNNCGQVKLPAQQRTDANGNYSISIKEPGVYYIVVSNTLGFVTDWGNYSSTGKGLGPYTVEAGDDLIMPDIIYN